ncbi:phage virion morphogenesis protein [Klebsiella pneumoniae]|uniref:Phage virion morphogenesis protein n=1 Tax=Klebsiella pneumoniae TaxID=573 RepID=A0A483MHZ7_KLEPN|nr:phage virion morphogenesis protein [Klebsiella pneumoniae]HDS4942251.1 phage virion morphogenesis protein [Klebsiella pneumoniae subsp. ozaenae]HDS5722624.1 phage virion morphogenesis protein [Klebsiella pneumoniae subsp. pneumoniae]MCM6309670.1 phage virion morphogenesis protein [Klebsiella pneumoniae]MCR1016529.1 phage virion morphogenesis protein [Klebsiella pneumoniae]MCR1031028.1 phage virion morphogenesis protein [Klebsiella pneumoniae]
MAELQEVDAWLDALLAGLEPAARKRMMRELAQQLRRSQQKNIRMQRNPDGTAYEPRRVTARTKQGRIRRQMFAKLRTTKYLKALASQDAASVEFESRVQRIARVHHYGLRERVSRKGPEVKYAERRLLGLNNVTENIIRERLFFYLSGGE